MSLRRTINHAKKLYFHTQFEKHEGNGTKTWRTVDKKSYHRWTGNPFMMRIKFHVHSCYFKMNSEILSNLVFQ